MCFECLTVRGAERSVRSDNVVPIIQIVDNFVTIAFGRNISKEMQLKFLNGKLRRNPSRLPLLLSSFYSHSCLFHINLKCIFWLQKCGKQTNNVAMVAAHIKCSVSTGENKCMKCNEIELNHSSSMSSSSSSSLPSRLEVDSIMFDSLCLKRNQWNKKETKIPDHFMWLLM